MLLVSKISYINNFMATLHRAKRIPTDYGRRYNGTVKYEDETSLGGERTVPITWREPPRADRSRAVYVLPTPLFVGKSAMRIPAMEVVKTGNIALTIDYTNKGLRDPLRHNARDVAATVEAIPNGHPRRAAGMSMGGKVLAEVLARGLGIESASFVASAGFMLQKPSLVQVIQHFGSVAPEVATLTWRDPIGALHLGRSCVHNCFDRNLAVAAELSALPHSTAHDAVRATASTPDRPLLRFIYGADDKLLPAWAQEEGIAGLPFDDIVKYPGGHLAFVHDPQLVQSIFEGDEYLLSSVPKKAAA